VDDDIAQILIPRERIAQRVAEMAAELDAVYGQAEEGLTIVTILSGSIIFLADLIRQLPIRMKIALITVSSYSGATTSSRGASLVSELKGEIRGRHVLIVDDILDTGGTLRLVTARLREQAPASVRTCVLLRKPSKAPPDVSADFVGFDVDDVFVVGYGLDYNDLYRNYPHIGVLRPELYAAK
jgi:hypoxanthine phosphoribosyltransferase